MSNINNEGFPAYQELRSCCSRPHNEKRAEQTSKQQLFSGSSRTETTANYCSKTGGVRESQLRGAETSTWASTGRDNQLQLTNPSDFSARCEQVWELKTPGGLVWRGSHTYVSFTSRSSPSKPWEKFTSQSSHNKLWIRISIQQREREGSILKSSQSILFFT